MTTKREVEAQVTRLAKQEHPDLPEAAARARIWAERPDLRQAYEQASEAQEILPPREPVQKGAAAFAKIDAAARQRYPDLYDKSPSRARTKVSEKEADLGDGYHREFWAS